MSDLVERKIKAFRDKYLNPDKFSSRNQFKPEFQGKMLGEFESFLTQAITEAQKETVEEIVREIESLPYHPEIEDHEGGQSIRQVTYTTDIVHLENIIKGKYLTDKENHENK